MLMVEVTTCGLVFSRRILIFGGCLYDSVLIFCSINNSLGAIWVVFNGGCWVILTVTK